MGGRVMKQKSVIGDALDILVDQRRYNERFSKVILDNIETRVRGTVEKYRLMMVDDLHDIAVESGVLLDVRLGIKIRAKGGYKFRLFLEDLITNKFDK